ncbi:6325_t:CDS:2, partial [Acaulospora colombiana]
RFFADAVLCIFITSDRNLGKEESLQFEISELEEKFLKQVGFPLWPKEWVVILNYPMIPYNDQIKSPLTG